MKRLSLICALLILALLSVVVSVSADAYLETEHDYANNMDETWTYTHSDPTADSLEITFSAETQVEENRDYIYIYTPEDVLVGQYTGTELAGQTITVEGSGFKIRLTSDDSGTGYGFAIDDIAARAVEEAIAALAQSYPESQHNYANRTDKTWTYEHGDASVAYLRITFNSQTAVESNYDYIYIYTIDGTQIGRYTGTVLAGQTVTVPGNGFKIRLTSDSSNTRYGFKIDSVIGCMPEDISNCTVTLAQTSVAYTGSALTPAVTVKDGDITLVEGTDYTVAYENNIEVGTAKVIVTGTGMYTGTAELTFEITRVWPESNHNYANYTDQTWVYPYEDPSVAYLRITFNDQTCVASSDYIYIYTIDGTQVGKYTGTTLAGQTVTVPGNGFKIRLTSNYSGTAYGFKIDSITGHMPEDLSNCTVTLAETVMAYTGSALTPAVTVKNGDITLVEGTDYTVAYENNIEFGTAKVIVTGTGYYFGTTELTFEIVRVWPESDHNYANYTDQTWAYPYEDPSVAYLKLTFNNQTCVENGNDYIYIYTIDGTLVGKYTGTDLAGKTVAVPGHAFKIRLTSDYSTTGYGFKIDSITGHGPENISKCTITPAKAFVPYTGSAQEVSVTVKDGDTTLVEGVDYTLSYENNVEVGKAIVTATGIGRYTGTLKKSFRIVEAYPESQHNYSNYTDKTWTYAYASTSVDYLKLTFNSQTSVESNYDYIYIYTIDGTQVGKYTGTALAGKTVTVPGNSFKIRLTSDSYGTRYGFKIVDITGHKAESISKCTIIPAQTSVAYDGTAKTPDVTVKDGDTVLVKGVDYTVSYQNNVDIGKAIIVVNGMGRYTGTLKKSFKIVQVLPESDHNYSNNTDKTWVYPYKNTAVGFIKITFSSQTSLENNRDFIYIYTLDDELVGKYTGTELAGKTVTVKDNGFKIRLTSDYSVTRYGFKIDKISGHTYKKLSSCTIKLSKTSVTYNGAAQKPTVTVKNGSKTLKLNTDYKVTYSKNTNVGTATVKITGMGEYTGTVNKTFTIKKLSLSKVSVEKISDRKYTGSAIKPKITVTSGGKTISASNYTVKYSSNTKVGTATVTLTAKGSNTSGSKKITFKIIPKISLSKKNLYEGKTFTLKLNGVSASQVKFSSSDTKVCTVNSSGVVKAVRSGDATIYAKYGGITYQCTVKVLTATDGNTSVTYYKNHDDVPDFGALLKIEPTSSTRSSTEGDTFLYSISDLQKVDPDKEAGDNYRKLLVKCGFTQQSGTTKIDGKYYYKYVSEKKIVYFGIASKNNEVKIIIKKA